MTRVYYKPGRLTMWALFWGLSGSFMLLGREDDGSMFDTVTGIVLLAMGVLAGAAAMDLRPAVTFDAEGLTLRTLFARRTLRWSELLVVQIEQRYLRVFGFVPIARRDYLSFLVQGGAIGSKRMRLLGSWLALPPGGLSRLRDTILAARGAAGAGTATATTTMDSVTDAGEDDGGFDADAAIARYLSAKAAAPAVPPPPLPVALVAPVPARPSFGRRIA